MSGRAQREIKRRGPQACDPCRRRKVRCDTKPKSGIKCSNCKLSGSECIYSEAKKRGPKVSYPEGYVESLELQLKNMGEKLKELEPDVDLEAFGLSAAGSSSQGSSPEALVRVDNSETEEEGDEDLVHVELTHHLQKLNLNYATQKFFGPSSAFVLLRNAVDLKDECTGDDPQKRYDKRPRYWSPLAWELRTAARWTPNYVYPEPDLLQDLVNNYFTQIHPYYPVLHAPIFHQSLLEGLHLRDDQFGAVVLLVCALGARTSDDPRVFLDDEDHLSAGWAYYEQVPHLRKELFNPPSLYELQACSLNCLYLHGTNAPQGSWTLSGIGLRLCVENGIHRRKPEGYKLTVEDELKKRCFWILMVAEVLYCSFSGRPSLLQDEEFDVEFPVECDDEFWQYSQLNGPVEFKQPPDVPSMISFFNRQIELCNILAPALRYLYPSKKAKFWMKNLGDHWERKTVAQLNRNLDEWTNKLPEHLKWNPMNLDQKVEFFVQSAILQTVYRTVQLQLHRPFIHKPSTFSANSLWICAVASRECIRVIDAQVMRSGVIVPQTLMALFMCGMMTLTNVWGAQRSGLIPVHEAKEWADIATCIKVCKQYEDRWTIAGRHYDLFQELTVASSSSAAPHFTAPPQIGTALPNYTHFTGKHQLFQDVDPSLDSVFATTPAPPVPATMEGSIFTDWAQYPSLGMSSEVTDLLNANAWSDIPVGFNLQDWGTYLADTGFNGLVDVQRAL